MNTQSPPSPSSSPSPLSPPKIIAHFVAGYPNYKTSLEIAQNLLQAGAYALEMQIPFSDPSADGPVIEEACLHSLQNGFKVPDAWTLLQQIRKDHTAPIFVMSYASTALAPGIQHFAAKASDSGANGLIIPDLVPGADEGLFQTAHQHKVPAVPVIVPWITENRLEYILSYQPQWIYTALRSGITGDYTQLGDLQQSFLNKLRTRAPKTSIMAGFGIRHPSQIQTLQSHVDAIVIGSAIVKTITSAGESRAGKAVREFLQTLLSS